MESVRALVSFNGRQSGLPDGEAAARYIFERLPQATRQSFPMTTVQVVPPLNVTIQVSGQLTTLENGRDLLPVLSGASVRLDNTRIVFVGYGISDAAHGLDEYDGLSVAGKVVLFLRGQPSGYAERTTHREKVRTARAHGAVAYLTVTGPLLSSYERRRGMSQNPMALYDGDSASLPGLWITPRVADRLLTATGISLASFQEEMDRRLTPRSQEISTEIGIAMEQQQINGEAVNVLGYIKGADPDLADETIVVGAHYDHFGNQGGIVFPGADDNASGTAVLMEIARLIGASDMRSKRSILFIAFAGEEQGLLGSKYFVGHPTQPLARFRAMINVDHAGVGNGKITVGLSTIEKAAAQKAGEVIGLPGDSIELFGLFPGGDHVPFADAKIPVAAIVSSGAHSNFHQPTDVPEKINPDILASVARYTLSLLIAIANQSP
jgi:hypothetical protein